MVALYSSMLDFIVVLHSLMLDYMAVCIPYTACVHFIACILISHPLLVCIHDTASIIRVHYIACIVRVQSAASRGGKTPCRPLYIFLSLYMPYIFCLIYIYIY
jgi:hypothetical protein